ncbi:hypothetical protein VFPBJ_00718 [Purpureocillium lilacinum]|uniref:Uncharacterized protein n=1 Tax=Purpureocillium lilacinum TaxID=33203 RepID=A0A179HAG8_PURLI|nr:hypothetical protein VFPBJ_00718 [Purpureocillium lilacinum]
MAPGAVWLYNEKRLRRFATPSRHSGPHQRRPRSRERRLISGLGRCIRKTTKPPARSGLPHHQRHAAALSLQLMRHRVGFAPQAEASIVVASKRAVQAYMGHEGLQRCWSQTQPHQTSITDTNSDEARAGLLDRPFHKVRRCQPPRYGPCKRASICCAIRDRLRSAVNRPDYTAHGRQTFSPIWPLFSRRTLVQASLQSRATCTATRFVNLQAEKPPRSRVSCAAVSAAYPPFHALMPILTAVAGCFQVPIATP